MEKLLMRTYLHNLGSPRTGKVRDVYDLLQYLFIVTTDRLSAFDVVLPTGIPGKGKVLNQISLFWFEKMRHIIPNHIVAAFYDDCPKELKGVLYPFKDSLADRSVLVHKAKPLAVEAIVRGYLSGSAWKEYKAKGTVCGMKLRDGYVESDKLDKDIFTPSTKAEEGHDINISTSEMIPIIGRTLTEKVHEISLAIYKTAQKHAEQRGIIIADTKFEFGLIDDGLVLIDELLTPDSSRFWSRATYEPGRSQDSLDKQIVRDYLETLDWDKTPPGPELPGYIVEKTVARYQEIYKILTA